MSMKPSPRDNGPEISAWQRKEQADPLPTSNNTLHDFNSDSFIDYDSKALQNTSASKQKLKTSIDLFFEPAPDKHLKQLVKEHCFRQHLMKLEALLALEKFSFSLQKAAEFILARALRLSNSHTGCLEIYFTSQCLDKIRICIPSNLYSLAWPENLHNFILQQKANLKQSRYNAGKQNSFSTTSTFINTCNGQAQNVLPVQYRHAKLGASAYLIAFKNNLSYTPTDKQVLTSLLEGLLDHIYKQTKISELYKAKESAENRLGIKREFLAKISHDIRSPISGIIGMADMLLSTLPSSQQQYYLKLIRDSACSLVNLLNDILDISKMEAGKLKLERQNFHLLTFLQRITDSYDILARKKEIRFKFIYDPTLPQYVSSAPDRLGQILSNLIGNALKFITEGQVIVEARLLKDKASSCEVQFSITDTGPGISQETVELIFKDYEQLQCSHLANQTGAGLGLGICKYLVELLGGKIWVESEIAKGSIFYFTVELEKAKSSAEIKPQYLLPTEKYSNMKLLKILLAEDATINQKFLCHFLTEQGHKVVPVQNGKEALSALEMENFDLVLMDVQMPEMDGVEATKRIREATSKQIDPNIPIIALTAYAMQEDKERFLQAGMNDYISKPLDMDKLLTVINKIADTKKMDTPGELQYSKTSSNSNQAINMEVLLSTYPPHFIRKMLQVFLDSADKTLAEIDEAIRTEEHALAEKRLHSLAGTAAIMKATSLKRKSRNLMQLAREQDTASLKNKFSELDGEMKKVTEFIRQLPLLKN